MKKLLCLSVLCLSLIFTGCGQDSYNNFKKLKNSFVEGDYRVTVVGNHPFEYMVKDSKITSIRSGYYLFYVDGKLIQTPIQMTVVEEQ